MPFYSDLRENDDPEFLEALDSLINWLVDISDRPELFVVRVDNWFDHKWLGFAGHAHEPYDAKTSDIIQPVPEWRGGKDVTLPPFSPNRILDQQGFSVLDEEVVREDSPPRVHYERKRPSATNLQNRILDFSQTCLIVWFSSRSGPNGRASLLAYYTRPEGVGGWYGSFKKTQRWVVDRVKNIDRRRVQEILSSFYDAETA